MYSYTLNQNVFQTNKNKLTGEEILINSGLEPASDYELLKELNNNELEPVQLDEIVNLSTGVQKLFAKPYKKVKIKVDDEKIDVGHCLMTPKEIIIEAGKNPNDYYLKQLIGHKEINYKNNEDLNHKIFLKPGSKFITCLKGPATVS